MPKRLESGTEIEAAPMPEEIGETEETTAEILPVGVAKERRRKLELEKEHKEQGIREAREAISAETEKENETAEEEEAYAEIAYGDFAPQKTAEGKIILTQEQQEAALAAIVQAKAADRFTLPHLAIGGKTATEYASRARNFSTETKIVELPDGKKGFLIHNYPSSWVHRGMDALGKWTAGARMRKAKSPEWKAAVEAKSNIPTIDNPDPNVVLMPFVENVNANDAIRFNREIEDFGVISGVKEYGTEEKLQLTESIVDELASSHKKGIAWGESILANVIVAEGGKPIIVDAETRYDEGVPLVEAKARDLRDLIQSTVSALRHSEKEIDVPKIVARLVERHPDDEVRSEIVRLSREKASWIRKLMRPIHEFPRLGANKKDYEAVLKALSELETE